MKYKSDCLAHYGVAGQKWGVRRYQNLDGTLTEEGKRHYYGEGDNKDWKRLTKDAKKDAEDYARAKAYYGQGAGNRRKIIRNRISERIKDPDYKAEFDRYMKLQDMEKHQKAANRERKVQDTKNFAAKTGRGLKNMILGIGSASMTAVLLYNAARYTGADKVISKYAKQLVSTAMKYVRR